MSDTEPTPQRHKPVWTGRPAETQTERGRLLSTPGALKLMCPQASNHLGVTAQGSRWLPRGRGQGLFIIGAGLLEEGPRDHVSEG